MTRADEAAARIRPGASVLICAASVAGLEACAGIARLFAGGSEGHLRVFHGRGRGPDAADESRRVEEACHARPEWGSLEFVALPTECPARAILQVAAEERPDFIVLTPYRHRSEGRPLVGSVSEEVVRGARIPVICVPFAPRATGIHAIETVLAATGGVRVGARITSRFGPQIRVRSVRCD